MAEFTNITVLGSGVLGSQIAFQTAYSGFTVVAYDIDDDALDRAKARFRELAETYREQVDGAAAGKAEDALANISYTSDLADAVQDADLVIEAVPEVLELKRALYTELGALAPEKTIFATNSSTLLPSDLKDYTGRPEKFLALHFANLIWIYRIAEVMGTTDTDPRVFRSVVEFARDMGMEPSEIKKEKAGYIINSLLVPFLVAAGELLVDGIADADQVDKTWRISTGSPYGPFQIYDIIGLTTMHNVTSASPDPKHQALSKFLRDNYIDHGKLGLSTGEGIYKYPAG